MTVSDSPLKAANQPAATVDGAGKQAPLFVVEGIAKSYGSVKALSSGDLTVYPGEVLGVVGDNGAGKSTLLKIMSGLIAADSGRLTLSGTPVSFASTLDARRRGIATVYQDLALVEALDIATNIFLGDFPTRRGFVQRKVMERETLRVMRDLKVRIGSVRTPVALLSGGQRQIVAICRAVRLANTSLILLDEPTAALGVRETAHVADIIGNLKSNGKAIVCVSHDMEFLMQHADRIHVMRLGRSVATLDVPKTSRDEIVSLITGASESGTHESGAPVGDPAQPQVGLE